jgi:hypothetical protein
MLVGFIGDPLLELFDSGPSVTSQVFKYKNSSCIHDILHIMVFSETLNLIPSKNIGSITFYPNFRNKGFSEIK